MRTAIIDDEAPARELLRALLGAWPSVEIVGEAGDGAAALRLIVAESPELVFLDVQMPGGSGFDVLSSLPPSRAPIIVFTTAFDQYALRAFEVSACDYLLKPFDASRLAKTMSRVLDLGARNEQVAASRLGALLSHLREPDDDIVVVKTEGRHTFVRKAEIEWVEAVGKEIRLHVRGGPITARESLNSIEQRLDSARFVRVHRSAIVSRSFVNQVQPWFKGDFVVVLRSGARIVTGRTFRPAVHSMIRGSARTSRADSDSPS